MNVVWRGTGGYDASSFGHSRHTWLFAIVINFNFFFHWGMLLVLNLVANRGNLTLLSGENKWHNA
jgi:hypothetical protein